MSKLFVVALCLLLVGVVSMADCRRTIREAPATTTDVDNSLTLTDLVKQTDDALKSLQANLLAFVGVKDTAELTTVLQTQTRSVADKLQATVTQIVEEAKNIQASEQVKGLTDKLTTQINDWKRENPEVVQSVENYKENLEKGLRTVATETQDFTAKLSAQNNGLTENLQKLLHKVYEDTLTATKSVTTQIEAAAKKQ